MITPVKKSQNSLEKQQNIISPQKVLSKKGEHDDSGYLIEGHQTQTSSPIQNYSLRNISDNGQEDETNQNISSHFLAQNDEIMEYEEEFKGSSTILPNSNQNIGTFDSLSRVFDISSNNLQCGNGIGIDEQEETQEAVKEKIYLRSCNQIERFAIQRRKKDLTLNLQSHYQNDSNSENSPKIYIEKRRQVKQEILTPNRRRSLPDFDILEKEPEISYPDMYKIYMGDTIDEHLQNNNDDDPYAQLDNLDGILQNDQIDEIDNNDEDDNDDEFNGRNNDHRHSTKNPIQYLKKQKSYKVDKEDEEIIDTPLKKFSKFEEDRYFVHKYKMKNGGITPLKYVKQEKKPSFIKSSEYSHYSFQQ